MLILFHVGEARFGKSFLGNLLMGKEDGIEGFPLGSAVEVCHNIMKLEKMFQTHVKQAETMGIWMWLRDHPTDNTKALMILNTEGINHTDGDATVDMEIFILAILLSTVFVYNVKSTIDANSIRGLILASELSEHVKCRPSSDQEATGTVDN